MFQNFENSQKGVFLPQEGQVGPKIIQIGFNKCGTRTLFDFFRKNSIAGVHYAQGRIGMLMALNRHADLPVLSFLGEFNFVADMMGPLHGALFEGHFLFKQMDRENLGARFILMKRPVDNWLKSRLAHPQLAERYLHQFDLPSEDALCDFWREQWDTYMADVRAHFDGRPDDLLEFDIETGTVDQIVGFLGKDYDLDPALWGHVGKTADRGKDRKKRAVQ